MRFPLFFSLTFLFLVLALARPSVPHLPRSLNEVGSSSLGKQIPDGSASSPTELRLPFVEIPGKSVRTGDVIYPYQNAHIAFIVIKIYLEENGFFGVPIEPFLPGTETNSKTIDMNQLNSKYKAKKQYADVAGAKGGPLPLKVLGYQGVVGQSDVEKLYNIAKQNADTPTPAKQKKGFFRSLNPF